MQVGAPHDFGHKYIEETNNLYNGANMVKGFLQGLLRRLYSFAESSDDVVLNIKPFVQLDDYSCGVQSLSSVLEYFGNDVDEDEVAEAAGLSRDGVDEWGIRSAIRQYGLRHRTMRRMKLADIQRCIDKDQPIIVAPQDTHWSVIYGYGEDSIYVMDPSLKKAFYFAGRRELGRFLDNWNRWGIAVYE
jgi:ABC-type bacteriocin/lantibiotic exporter with double-glycine peptidase domain